MTWSILEIAALACGVPSAAPLDWLAEQVLHGLRAILIVAKSFANYEREK